MEIMKRFYLRFLFKKLFYLGYINIIRYGIECEIKGIRKEDPGAVDDHDQDDKTGNRVDPHHACLINEQSRHHHSHRYTCISGHVQKSSFYIQVIFLPFHEKQRRCRIDNDSHTSDYHDGLARNFYGVIELVPGL